MTTKSRSPKLVSVTELAAALDLDKRRVQQLAAEGVLPRAGRGQYDVAACVRAYTDYRATLDDAPELSDGDVNAARKLAAEADLAEHKAELARLKVEEEQDRLIPAEQVADAWGKVLSVTKAKLLSIPSAVSPEVQSLQSVAEIEAHIRGAIAAALETLADIGTELAQAAHDAPGEQDDDA